MLIQIVWIDRFKQFKYTIDPIYFLSDSLFDAQTKLFLKKSHTVSVYKILIFTNIEHHTIETVHFVLFS